MDKDFWASISKNDYKIPDGHTLEDLTKTLFGYLGNTDPELRDDIAYIVYAHWLKQDLYTKDEIRAHINELMANLEKGIGETESDSVFRRAFSVLLLEKMYTMTIRSRYSKKKKSKRFSKRGYGTWMQKKTRAGISPSKAGHMPSLTPPTW